MEVRELRLGLLPLLLLPQLRENPPQSLIIRLVLKPVVENFSFKGDETLGFARAQTFGRVGEFGIADHAEFIVDRHIWPHFDSWQLSSF